MAELEITPQTLVGHYPATPLSANAADITFEASGADFADGASFPHTGREIILVRNDNVGAQTITIESKADAKNREGDITTYSIGASEYAAFGPFPVDGWRQSDGDMNFAVSAADLYLAVIRLPAGYP